ncbi:hypothetical protein RJ639_032866 [Escallonia herrerae]|uniref:F-box domain-containing protein n=1 Tax=Escallonia herrerae TaxID=1293975 RepID=A0AA88WWS0_9ASTE|nr:hypothetical protein RJ639_032866 [Escallonia herrerae]
MDDLFTDDLLIEILLWLPVEYLFKLKSVSKRWCRIISSSCFRRLYLSKVKVQDGSLSCLMGFFQSEAQVPFIPTCALADNDYTKLLWSADCGESFFAASNGLLLYYNYHSMAYHVCNPITKQCLSLPQPHYCPFNAAVGFDVEANCEVAGKMGSLKFKVVCLVLESLTEFTHTLKMECFSSDTRCWRDCTLRSEIGSILLRPREYAVVINGVYHWLESQNRVLAYDSKSSLGLDEDIAQVICLPDRYIGTQRSSVLGKSKDGLLQYGYSDSFKIVVWVLEVNPSNADGRQQWVLRHTVSFKLMCHRYPDIMTSCDLILSGEDLQNERSANVPQLVAFHSFNSSVVFMRLDKKIICCCLDKGKLKVVQLRGSNYLLGERSGSNLPVVRQNTMIPYFSPDRLVEKSGVSKLEAAFAYGAINGDAVTHWLTASLQGKEIVH